MTEIAPLIPPMVPAFRVGITGARLLAPSALPLLENQLNLVLSTIKANIEALAREPLGAELYAPGAMNLRFISPLAEGADRLAAKAAVAQGYQLEAPLPFAQHDYERDFPTSVAAFRDLLAQAAPHVLELGGARGDEENRSYEAVGRLVVRNCDLLIAIWDGGKGNGRGGTADIVRYAARHGHPIWWLQADGTAEPLWVEKLHDLRQPEHLAGRAAWEKLEAYLRTAILPPPTASTGPLTQFLIETPQPDRFIWSLYQRAIRLAAGRPKIHLAPPVTITPPSGVWIYWQNLYMPIDQLAVAYGNRYRSSYVLVFGLAALALAFAAFGIGTGLEALIAGSCELASLIGIFLVVRANVTHNWHGRLIAYRLLAELCRKQQALALFGWSLKLTTPATTETTDDPLATLPRDIWVGWFFNAAVRAAPLPQASLQGAPLKSAFEAVQTSLVAGQVDYHVRRQHDSEAAAHRFGQLGRAFFIATVVVVILKIGQILYQIIGTGPDGNSGSTVITDILRLLQGLLPGMSAAFVGIRGYAELELLADQSAQMQRLMTHAEAMLQHLDLEAPLASEDVGAELLQLAEAMMHDIKGWAQLFRLKAVETG